jgi:hypothetical protein
MSKKEKLTLNLSVILPDWSAEERWNFIQWVQEDFKAYAEVLGDVKLNYTMNEFWRSVLKFDVKVTGTAKPKPPKPEPEPEIVPDEVPEGEE